MKIFKNHRVLTSAILLFAFQSICYYIPKIIYPTTALEFLPSIPQIGKMFSTFFETSYHHDLTIIGFDTAVPLISIFIIPYHLAHVWWMMTPFIVFHYLKQKGYQQYYTSSIIAYIVCMVMFIVIPTYIPRADIMVNNVFDWLVAILFMTDSPVNLFPSMHVLISWFAFMTIRSSKEVPIALKISQFIMATIVILSTQFVKQHYVVDIIAGILVAEIVYFIVKKTNIDEKFTWIPFYHVELKN